METDDFPADIGVGVVTGVDVDAKVGRVMGSVDVGLVPDVGSDVSGS